MTRKMIIAMVLAISSPVLADDWQSAFFSHSSAYRNPLEHRHHRPRIVVRERYVPVPARSWARRPVRPAVAGWNSDEDTAHLRRDFPHCKHDHVRVVGMEAHSEEIARQRAIQQWSANVRFAEGERYMSVEAGQRCDAINNPVGVIRGTVVAAYQSAKRAGKQASYGGGYNRQPRVDPAKASMDALAELNRRKETRNQQPDFIDASYERIDP